LTYLRILRLAAREMESEVAAALEILLETPDRWNETDVEHLLQPEPILVPQLACRPVKLEQYDDLLTEVHRGA
jgi:hypothetical protein